MTSTAATSVAHIRLRVILLLVLFCGAIAASTAYELWDDYVDTMRRAEERATSVSRAVAQHVAQLYDPSRNDPIGLPKAALDALHQAIGINPGDSLLLLHENGTILFRAAGASDVAGQRVPPEALMHRMRVTDSGTIPASLVDDGVRRLVAYQRIEATPLILVAGVDMEAAFARMYRHGLREAIAAVAILLVVGALAWRLRRRFAELRRATDDLGAAQQSVQRAFQRMQETLASVADGLVAIDHRGRIEIFNRTAERIFGYPAADAIGRNVSILMPEPFHSEHDSYLENYLRTGEAKIIGRGREVIGRRRDGSVFPLDLAVSEIPRSGPDQHETPRRFIAVVRDLSDRKRLEAELRSAKSQAEIANRAKGSFLAHMSHELRTPLNAVIGFSEVIEHQLFGNDPEKYASYARDIRTSGMHLLELLNDILDMSKLEAGRYDLHEEHVDIAQIVETCLSMLRLRAETNGVSLVVRPFRTAVVLRADARALRQVVLNLLSNAVKFTPNGGAATVSWSIPESGELVLSVADTGIGIAPEVQALIFQPFERGETKKTQHYEGTGLGLAISKNLVELHGGTITLTSAPDHGTVVTIRFPADRLTPGFLEDRAGSA